MKEENDIQELVEIYLKTNDETYLNKLIENNMGIIYYYLKLLGYKRNKSESEKLVLVSYTYDDLVSISILELINSLKYYDVNRGYKFSSFYFRFLSNRINLIRRIERKEKNTFSLNSKLYNNEKGEAFTVEDTIPADIYIEEDVTFNITKEQVLEVAKKKFNESQKRIYEMYYEQEIKQGDIARILGISQAQVSRSLSICKKIITKIYNKK